jgi:hypothetical protein
VRESEGGRAALWLSSIRVRDGGRWRHAARPDGRQWLGRPEEGERPRVGRLGEGKRRRREAARLHALRRVDGGMARRR